MELIKSTSYSQEDILLSILRLHIPEGCFEVDATYSTGGFYRTGRAPQPLRKYDLSPQCPDVIQADCRALPLAEGSIRSLILDPPFLATKGPSLATSAPNNRINRRFSVCSSERELYALYSSAIKEAARVLASGGVLVIKCQDKVSSGKQYMMHCDIYNWAVEAGFEPLDLFVLLARNRLVANWQRNQRHARKYHCYFWVFRRRQRKEKAP